MRGYHQQQRYMTSSTYLQDRTASAGKKRGSRASSARSLQRNQLNYNEIISEDEMKFRQIKPAWQGVW